MNDPQPYEIRVEGRLDDYWGDWLEGFTLIRAHDRETTFRGLVDQAALHGVLIRIRDLGLTLVSVNRLDRNAPRTSSPS